MKTGLKIFALLMTLSTQLAFGQDRQTTSKYLTLDKSTKQQVVEIEIVGPVDQLKIELSTTLYNGIITAEIIAPNGELQGKFKAGMPGVVEFDKDGDEIVKEQSRLEKHVLQPDKGVWKVKVFTDNASGYLRVESRQLMKKEKK